MLILGIDDHYTGIILCFWEWDPCMQRDVYTTAAVALALIYPASSLRFVCGQFSKDDNGTMWGVCRK